MFSQFEESFLNFSQRTDAAVVERLYSNIGSKTLCKTVKCVSISSTDGAVTSRTFSEAFMNFKLSFYSAWFALSYNGCFTCSQAKA